MTHVWDMPAVRAGLEQQFSALAELENRGARLLGWKVGVGTTASMDAAGIPAPLVGFLTSATVLDSAASVSLGGWVRPMLEPEIAIWLGEDVPANADTERINQAVIALGPAIELADVDAALSDLTAVVGGDIFHRAVIFGEADHTRRGGRTDGLHAIVERGAERIAETEDVSDATGSPTELVRHVAAWLAAGGRTLEAGQVIIGGSVVPIIPVAAGDRVIYRCNPLPALQVSFTD